MKKHILIFSFMTVSLEANANDPLLADTIVSAERAIKNQLKDPDSVNFRDVFYNNTEAGGSVACGKFNAKNSFGAYTGYKRFISNGSTTFVEGVDKSNPPFPKLWVLVCSSKK